MNGAELTIQINRFKARKSKTRLAYLCLFISLFLSLSTLGSGISLSSLSSFFLTLPLSLYFASQSYKLTKKNRDLKNRMISLSAAISNLETPHFSFLKFLTQPSLTFRFSLILLFLISFTLIARIRTDNTSPSITYQSNMLGQNP